MELAQLIDHTYLKPEGTLKEINQLIEEAKTHHFKSVCIQPSFVAHAAQALKHSDVLVCTVVGFPLGANTLNVKAYETEDALANGADEIDMVAPIGALKAHDFDRLKEEVRTLKALTGPKPLKVILETAMLDDETILKASEAAFEAGADFVKTSTGFGPGGASIKAVKLMARVANGKGVKASGGVRSLEDAKAMINAGATRIGTSNGVAIVTGSTPENSY